MLSCYNRSVQGVGALGFDGDDLGCLAGPGEGGDGLHDSVDHAAAADGADYPIDGTVYLVAHLGDHGRSAVPEMLMVERRYVNSLLIIGNQLLPHIRIRLIPITPMYNHLDAQREQLLLHQRRRISRQTDSRRPLQRDRSRSTRQPSVAARGAVEMHRLRVGRCGKGAGHEVAHAAGLEGATGLQVLELEVDVAVGEAGELGGVDCGGLDPGEGCFGGEGTHFGGVWVFVEDE